MKRLILLSVLACGAVFAQTNTCSFTFSFTQATGFGSQPAPTTFDNRLKGCNFFTVNYQATGLSAVNVLLESAGGPNTQGTFGAYSGSTVTGANPLTSTTGTQGTFSGYVGWLRITASGTASAATWAIRGVVYGSLTGGSGTSPAGSTCPSGGAAACFVQGAGANGAAVAGFPVRIGASDGTNARDISSNAAGELIPASVSTAGADGLSNTQRLPAGTAAAPIYPRVFPSLFNGATYDREILCTMQAVTVLAPGTTGKIVTNTGGGKTVKICHIHETSGTTSANVTIRSGTSLQCATGTTTIDGLIGTTGFVFDYSPVSPLKANAANDDICMDFNSSLTATILVIYAEVP